MNLNKKQIEIYKDNPILAAKELLNIRLEWWQEQMLNNLQYVKFNIYRRK